MVRVAAEEVKVFITIIIIIIIIIVITIIIIIIIIIILFYHYRAVAKLIILGSKCFNFLAKLGQNSKSKTCMVEFHPFLVIATALFFREHSHGTL